MTQVPVGEILLYYYAVHGAMASFNSNKIGMKVSVLVNYFNKQWVMV